MDTDKYLKIGKTTWTKREVQDLLNAQAENTALATDITDVLNEAAWSFESAKETIYGALLYRDSPTWLHGLSVQRDELNSRVKHFHDLARRIIHDYPLFKPHIEELSNFALNVAGLLNNAITSAIGDKDEGRALEALANDIQSPAAQSLKQRLDLFKTEHLLQDSRMDRGAIYIATRCIDLESNGVKVVRQQWQKVYHELRLAPTRPGLEGDAKAAWEWFEDRKPFKLNLTGKRQFEQEISRLKAKVSKSVKTSDKVPTSNF